MQNRYEEASKELEKLRAMNRYLSSSLKSQDQANRFKSTLGSKSKKFLSELDEDYVENRRDGIPNSARLRYAGRMNHSRAGKQFDSDDDDRNESFLTSDMPNESISRLNKSSLDSSRRNVSFGGSSVRQNQSFSGSMSQSFSALNESSSKTATNRHLSRLDLEEKPNVGTSTYRPTHEDDEEEEFLRSSTRTDNSPSRMNRSTQTNRATTDQSHTSHHLNQSSTSSSSFISDYKRAVASASTTIPATINPHTSSTSVIAAFRELQNKIKAIENERYLLHQEKDELKNTILELKRKAALEKNKIEIETTESLLSLRGLYEKAKKTHHDLQYQLLSQQDIQATTERKIQSQEQYYHSLQEDIIRIQEKILAAEKQKMMLEKDQHESQYRVQDIEVLHRLSPQKHAREEIPLQQQLTQKEMELQQLDYDKQKISLKIDSLQSYIDVIIKINGDLCDTLVDREKAKHKFLRSLSPPPRYAWPKEIPYNDILAVVNDTAKVHASAVLEHSAVKATEAAMKSIIEAISPSKSPNKSPLRSTRQSNSRSGSPNDYHRSASHSYRSTNSNTNGATLDYTMTEAEPTVRNSPSRIQSRLERSMENLSKSQQRRLSRKDLEDPEQSEESEVDEKDKHHSVHFDDTQLDMHSGEEDNDTNDYPVLDGHYSDSGLITRRKKTTRGRVVKRKGSNGGGGGKKRSSSLSSARRHTSSSLARRQANSFEKLITRQGAINSATRFAAAATAAVNAGRVVTTPKSNTSRASSPGASSTGRRVVESKIDFIPSSGTASSEFNVIASVSKASRAAKQLNAHLASKVKSVYSGGIGTIFDEVPRVDLVDMQHQLNAVKKMRETLK